MLGRGLDRATVAYGVAHFGKIVFWYTSELLFAYYLSEVCGLSPTLVGHVLAASFVVGAVADLALSHALRGRLARVGPAVRVQALGACASGITLLALLSTAFLPPDWRLPIALLCAAAFRLSYVLLDLPQNVLLSIATDSPDDRSRVASLRIFGSSAGSLLVALSLARLLSNGGGPPPAVRFILLAALLSLFAAAGALALARAGGAWTSASHQEVGSAASALRAIAGFPRQLWLNVAMSFVITLFVSSFGKVAPFYASYVVPTAAWSGWVLPCASLGSVLSQPAWGWVALRVGRAPMLLAGALLLAAAALGFRAGGAGVLTAGGCAFLIGASSSGMGMTLWAAFGDLVASDRRIAQAGAQATAYATLTAALKIALALGSLGLGAVLNRIDYRGAQTAWLVELMSWPSFAAGVAVLAVLALSRTTSRFQPK